MKSRPRSRVSATKGRNFRTFLLMRELAGREIGARIAQARMEAGRMTQEELADLLGVTMRSVQNYEAGDVIPWRHFQRLEEIFKRPLSWFLHGDEEKPEDRALADRLSSVELLLAEVLAELRARPPEHGQASQSA